MFRPQIFYPALFGNMATAATGPLVYDTFVDTPGLSIPSHTPDIAPVGSAWDLRTGFLYAVIDSGDGVGCDIRGTSAFIDSGVADCVITATMFVPSGYFAGVTWRNTAPSSTTYWRAVMARAAGALVIQQVTNNVATTRASQFGVPLANNTTYTVTVTLSGTDMSANFDVGGGYTLNYSSATGQANTYHGIIEGNNVNTFVSSFQVDAS